MWPESPVGVEPLILGSFQFTIVGDPSPEAWSRVHRYASWMHQVSVDAWSILGEETFLKLHLNAPDGRWFPALEHLSWCFTESNHPYIGLFFSPYLKRISISVPWSWSNSKVPHNILPAIASTISTLPAPALQHVSVDLDCHGVPLAYFKESLSSVVLRCGPPLTEFFSLTLLSDAATNHLIHLPHLRAWHTKYPPPNYSSSSLPLVFPALREFTVGGGAGRGWISLFERLGNRLSSTQATTPLSGMRESLEYLSIGNFPDSIIYPSFTYAIQIFRNLVGLNVTVACRDGQCIFKLNNDNVAELAMALPRLKSLLLGYPCDKNTCATTVACLLPISVHCARLQSLEIHLNTTNIVEDLKNISEDPQFQELRSLQKCTLSWLDVHRVPLTLDKSDFGRVARGMVDIFPNLERCDGWGGLNWEIGVVQRVV